MVLGDVGGLFGLIFSVFASINAFTSGSESESFLISKLYTQSKDTQEPDKKCCKFNKREKFLEKGRDKLADETDFVKML